MYRAYLPFLPKNTASIHMLTLEGFHHQFSLLRVFTIDGENPNSGFRGRKHWSGFIDSQSVTQDQGLAEVKPNSAELQLFKDTCGCVGQSGAQPRIVVQYRL